LATKVENSKKKVKKNSIVLYCQGIVQITEHLIVSYNLKTVIDGTKLPTDSDSM